MCKSEAIGRREIETDTCHCLGYFFNLQLLPLCLLLDGLLVHDLSDGSHNITVLNLFGHSQMPSAPGLQSGMIMGLRVQTRPGARVGQPSRNWYRPSCLGGGKNGDGEEIGAAVTMPVYRKVVGL